MTLGQHQFWREVLRRTAERVRLVVRLSALLEGNVFGEAEVNNLYVAGGIHEKILGLQIAVRHAEGMNVPERADHTGGVKLKRE